MKETHSSVLEAGVRVAQWFSLFQLTWEPVVIEGLVREREAVDRVGPRVSEVGRKWRTLKHRGDVDCTGQQ